MLSMSRWEHERTLGPAGAGPRTAVTDRITFELCRPLRFVPGLEPVVAAGVGGLFGHRHRRLGRAFQAA